MWRQMKRLFHQASIGDQSYRFLFDRGPEGEVVVIDTETTGLDPRTDDIITIAAIKVRGNRILTSERFEAFARPDAKLDPEAIKVHRLREADVEGGQLIFRLLPDFLHFIGGRPLVGYYIDFDIAMLDKYIIQLIGVQLPNPASRYRRSTTSANMATPRPVRRSTCASRRSCRTSACRNSPSTTPSTIP